MKAAVIEYDRIDYFLFFLVPSVCHLRPLLLIML